MTRIENLINLEETLNYLYDKLNWPIKQDSPAIDPYEVNWEYYPEDLGLKDSDFAKITTLQQMKPLTENQDWAVFFIEFDSKKMQISVLRKILGGLIYNKRNTDHKIWDKENLLFICFWGEKKNRTIGFIHFNESVKGLPTLKALYFEPQNEEKALLERYEAQLSHLNWEYCEKCDAWTGEWKKAFTTEYGKIIRDTDRLTTELAHSAQKIRKQILEVLEVENENGYVHKLLKKFKDMLVHDMNESTFADMYAQTISYGLFSARCMNVEEEIFDPLKAIDNIPDTNPFLRQLLREGLDSQKGNVKKSISFDELELASIIDLLQNTDIKAIVQNFNRLSNNGKEDPVIHFYENFLTEYDKEAKVNRGVYYTPFPVVDFIVRSIDCILKNEFEIKDGLACDEHITPDGRKKSETVPRVQILDPATGTGTFLRQTILQIKRNFDESHKQEDWSRYVTLSLLNRLYGFELMMAPYAVAHMKIAMALKETGYNFASKTRLKLFLTNSLEEPGDSTGQQSLFDEDPIAIEATEANRIKKEAKINVVIGNPPYSGESSNQGIKWIEELMQDYKKEPGGKEKLKEKNPKWINADEYKFMRFAQHYIEKNGKGILAYICPCTFVDGVTFRGMRWNLAKTFDKIYILNLHGNAKKEEVSIDGSKDENVFPIQQGVSINIFVKNNLKKSNDLAEVYYSDCYGTQQAKFEYLKKNNINTIDFKKIDLTKPYYFFYDKNEEGKSDYYKGFSLTELMTTFSVGMVTAKDSILVSSDESSLLKNVNNYYNEKANKKYIKEFDYRLFDKRFVYFDTNKIERPREEITNQFNNENIGLCVCKQFKVGDNWQHVFISNQMIESCYVSNKTSEITTIFPLFLYDTGYDKSYPNFNEEIINEIKKIVGDFSALQLFDYIYAVLFTPNYRLKYKEFLKIDFPHIPYPSNKELFFTLAKTGSELRELHLMKTVKNYKSQVHFSGSTPTQNVTQNKFENGKVWINKTEYFEGISESTWNFYIGGYQVAEKWIKDRKGRILSEEEIEDYERIINILIETEYLMSELDKIWEA